MSDKTVLDACCGPRMMWFDKTDARVLYVDRRVADYAIMPDKAYPNGTTISVHPDVLADFSALPFQNESFWHVVLDPPHVERQELLGTITKKYGALTDGWRENLKQGFAECFRVLKPGGTLIFKWCDVEIPLAEILCLTPMKPLYGHRSGKKAGTHWVSFLKHPEGYH